MNNQSPIKTNNPAPTVEQINADGITQVKKKKNSFPS